MDRLTREQAAVIGAFTGTTCGPFGDLHRYAERLLGGPVGPASLSMMADQLKELARPDFMELCADA